MAARRCSIHGLNWPMDDEYKSCPLCEEPTSVIKDAEPMDPAEAHSLAAHARFDRYYLKTRGVLPESEDPLPADGRAAFQEIADTLEEEFPEIL